MSCPAEEELVAIEMEESEGWNLRQQRIAKQSSIHKSVAPLHTSRSSDIKQTVRNNETYVRDKFYVHDVASTGRMMHEMQAKIEVDQMIAHLYRTAVVKSSDFIFLPSARTPLEEMTHVPC